MAEDFDDIVLQSDIKFETDTHYMDMYSVYTASANFVTTYNGIE